MKKKKESPGSICNIEPVPTTITYQTIPPEFSPALPESKGQAGSYRIKFYNHDEWFVVEHNGKNFEWDKNTQYPNDEIETRELIGAYAPRQPESKGSERILVLALKAIATLSDDDGSRSVAMEALQKYGNEPASPSSVQGNSAGVDALLEACKEVVRGYEGDGMENMHARDDVFYRECKKAIAAFESAPAAGEGNSAGVDAELDLQRISYNKGIIDGQKLAAAQLPGAVEFEMERLYDWIMDENRMPAVTAFTSGTLRKVADEIAFRLFQNKSTNGN